MEAIKAAVSVDKDFEYFHNNMYKAAVTTHRGLVQLSNYGRHGSNKNIG